MYAMKYLLILFLLSFSPAVLAANLVTHNEQVRVDRGTIRLGDVFSGLAVADDVEIAIAPAAGKAVTYDYSVLSKLSQRYNLNWQASSLNDKSVITRAAQRISTEMIRAAIIEQLKSQGISGEIDVVLDQRGLELNLPTDAKPDFTLHDFHVDKGSMRFTAQLLAAIDTPAFQQVAVTGRATAVVDVPVLNKPLAAGTVIGAADLDWIKLPLDRANDYLRTAESVVGRELKRQMSEQAALKLQDVLPPRIVLRGSLVTMQVVMPGMTLTAQGHALQDGALGDIIRITNTQSNRVVEAKVMGSGAAEIIVTAQLASLQ
jgi:flagellar basal body P-ring formation protein FlgA